MTSTTPRIGTAAFHRNRDTAPIAIAGGTALDAGMLELAAAAIRARLAGVGGDVWGVYLESPFLQIAALTALQSLGRRAVLLPHVQPQFLESIRARLDGLLTDQPVAADGAIHLPSPAAAVIAEGEGLPPASGDWQHAIGFLTSGSSGAPACVWKTPDELTREIEMVEAAFGARTGRDRILHGTTSHQHLFGFTFRVIWPLLTGRTFSDRQIRIPSDVDTAIHSDGRIVLVSSPAFLCRAEAILSFETLAAAELLVFSSGGPLPGATAMRFNRTPNVSLVEIYGSTETGALAQRLTADDRDTPWQPLPGVEIEIVDGLLTARAPHFNRHRRQATADRATAAPGGGFLLAGRSDRIVKVADKRVSLDELEQLLAARPDIVEARVLQFDDGSLAAVVAPAQDGWREVRRTGKSRYTRRLRDHLARHVDRVTTPKRWRLVKRVPRNPQGKIELAALRSLFAVPAADFAVPAAGQLQWQTLHSDPACWSARANVPADLPELNGHFPGEPIVPGVAQLHWAAAAARRHFGLRLSGAMANVKLRHPIRPGRVVTLSLRLNATTRRVEFELCGDQQVYSSGRLLLEQP